GGDPRFLVRPLYPAAAADIAGGRNLDDPARLPERVVHLSRGLGAGGSYRGEALRRVVLRLGRALAAVLDARGQNELVDSGARSDVLGELEAAVDDLSRLVRGAARRLLGSDPAEIRVLTDGGSISALVERAVSSGTPANPEALELAIRALVSELPAALGSAAAA